jgi:hypothetical protein
MRTSLHSDFLLESLQIPFLRKMTENVRAAFAAEVSTESATRVVHGISEIFLTTTGSGRHFVGPSLLAVVQSKR